MTSKQKAVPREFCLHDEGMWYGSEELPPTNSETMFHVVEISALTDAQAQIQRLERQLCVAIECLNNYRTLVIEEKNGSMTRLGKSAEDALNLMAAINKLESNEGEK